MAVFERLGKLGLIAVISLLPGTLEHAILSGRGDLMTVQIDIWPETAAKFQAAATALNLSLQEYLERIAGNIVLLSSGQDSQSTGQQASTPYELGKAFIGKIDSSVPDSSTHQDVQPRNEVMLAIIERSHERLKDMPVRGSTEETLKMIRRARAGEMWGYEPTDADIED